MAVEPLRVMAVVGSLNRGSCIRCVLKHAAHELRSRRVKVDWLDLLDEPLALFNPDISHASREFRRLQTRVERADVYILGTPDYHGSISSVLKNFLDHFWHEFTGKLFATLVASNEKGLTVTDQLRTVARQCYAWTLPYGISFSELSDLKDGKITSEPLLQRLEMMVHDVCNYGSLIACQRRADLTGRRPGFLAHYRRRQSLHQSPASRRAAGPIRIPQTNAR